MTAREALSVGLALIGTVFLLILLVALHRVAGVIFLGVVVGVTLSPIADWLAGYRVPRAFAVILVYLVIAVALAGFGWYAGQSVASDLDKFNLDNLNLPGNLRLPTGEDLRNYLGGHAQGLSGTITTSVFEAASVVVDFVTIFVVGVLFVVARDHLESLVLELTPPAQRDEAARILKLLGHRVRRAVLGLFLGMVAIGVLVYIGLRIISLPFPFVLAFFAFLTEILPFIGPWLAVVPALLVAVTQGWVTLVQTVVVYLIIYQIESHLLVPILHSTVNRIPALLVITAVLIGGALMGILGALVAIPVAVIAQTLFFEAFMPWWRRKIGESPHQADAARDEAV